MLLIENHRAARKETTAPVHIPGIKEIKRK
jgi:hypothetical protein